MDCSTLRWPAFANSMQCSALRSNGARDNRRVTRRIVVATRSAGKMRELLPILQQHDIDAMTLDALGIEESPQESTTEAFGTFEENALAKAAYFARLIPDAVVLADDSGLEVDALGGAPGVFSK